MSPPDDPRHGTRAGYIAGCRDDCCREPHLRYQKLSTLRRHREGIQWLDNHRVLARLAWWDRRGVSSAAIAAAAGLSDATLREIRSQDLRVTKHTEQVTLAVTWDDLPPESLVYADLTRLRIYSAMASGHPQTLIFERLDQKPRTGNWRIQQRVSVGLARAVLAVYDRLPAFGPSAHTASRTRRRGWPVMAAWDDPGTLSAPLGWWPELCPDERKPTRAEVLEHLAEVGLSAAEACGRLGIDRGSLYAWCRRHGRLRMWRLLTEREAS